MVFGFRKRAEATEAPIDPIDGPEPETAEASGIDQRLDQLEKFKKMHQWDYNLDIDQIDTVNAAAASDDIEKKTEIERSLLEEDSPYFEVRAAVRNYDE